MIISDKIVGKKIYLRSLAQDDVNERYVNFLNDQVVTAFLETRHQIWTQGSILQYLLEINQSNHSLLLGIFTLENLHIGNIKCGPIHPIHKCAALSLFIGDKAYWRKGYAPAAIHLMCALIFEKFDVYKLSAGMYKDNVGSLRAFEKSGFQIEGIFKDHYILKDAIRTDLLQVGITKDQFFKKFEAVSS